MTSSFYVPGLPAPQGSKSAYRTKRGRIVVVEKTLGLPEWRDAVTTIARFQSPVAGPVIVSLTFHLPRPRSHYGTGRNSGTIRPGAAGAVPCTKPDIDKLVRATLDALTASGIIQDDARVVDLHSRKRYAERCGARITVEPYTGDDDDTEE